MTMTLKGVTYRAFSDELGKVASRAGLRVIRKLMEKGTPEALAQANRLAKAPGVLKASPMGSPIRRLGRGGEGIADLVAHPQYGVSVRKLYDPTSGIASGRQIGRKMQLAKDIQSPLLAETHGFARTGRGGRLSFHEYVPGGAPSLRTEFNLKRQLQGLGRKKGWDIQDVRAPNIVGGKAIDVLPFRGGETMGMGGLEGNLVILTPKGMAGIKSHMAKSVGRLKQGPVGAQPLATKDLNRLLGGGGKGTALSDIASAPTRAPLRDTSSRGDVIRALLPNTGQQAAIKKVIKKVVPTKLLPSPKERKIVKNLARARMHEILQSAPV